jgi:ABC-type multidrug transport system fused ATPase/permease subunit
VERLRPHPSAGWHAVSGALVCAAAAAALGSLVSLTPASMASGPVAATLWPWVAGALVLGAPISLLLVILGGRWPALAPLPAMALASQIAVPALLGDVRSVSALDVAELAPHATAAAPNMSTRKEDTAAEESKKRLAERMKEVAKDHLAKWQQSIEEQKRRLVEWVRGQNRTAEIVSRALTMMAWGAIMGLAAVLGAALASAALRTPLSWLATVAAAAVAAPIASEIALGLAGLSTLLAAIGGFAVFYAGLGGALGYLMGRGGVAR